MTDDSLVYTDIHAHLADPRIVADAAAIVAESRGGGVGGILVNAARRDEWSTVVALTALPGVWGALGLHPFFLDEWDDDLPRQLAAAVRAADGIVAIGEIGLDCYNGRQDLERQMMAFNAQLAVAVELGLPVIVHNRRSWGEFLHVLDGVGRSCPVIVCHHFSGSIELARQLLDRGCYLSFCGPLTYANARRIKAAAAFAPLDRVLTETDTPDLPPIAARGRLSCPADVRDVAAELARLRQQPQAVVISQVATNFRTVTGRSPWTL